MVGRRLEEAAATGNRTRRQQEEEKKTPREPQKRHGRGRKARRGAGQAEADDLYCRSAPWPHSLPQPHLLFLSLSLTCVVCVCGGGCRRGPAGRPRDGRPPERLDGRAAESGVWSTKRPPLTEPRCFSFLALESLAHPIRPPCPPNAPTQQNNRSLFWVVHLSSLSFPPVPLLLPLPGWVLFIIFFSIKRSYFFPSREGEGARGMGRSTGSCHLHPCAPVFTAYLIHLATPTGRQMALVHHALPHRPPAGLLLYTAAASLHHLYCPQFAAATHARHGDSCFVLAFRRYCFTCMARLVFSRGQKDTFHDNPFFSKKREISSQFREPLHTSLPVVILLPKL